MEGKGILTIETYVLKDAGKSYVGVKICDTGHGIQDDIKGKIFDPFFYNEGCWQREWFRALCFEKYHR